jgi:hypothetical protein
LTDSKTNFATSEKGFLEFEHIVQVNEPENPTSTDISRAHLWEGLVLRARSPQRFIEGIECFSHPQNGECFVREISAGDSHFYEDVTLEHESRVLTKTQRDKPQIHAESEATIEEPEAGYLFVRFRYRRELPDEHQAVDIGEHLKAAYARLDNDAIKLIRVMAENDSFTALVN